MGDRLNNKVAVVTGGGQGIGRGIACAFASEGARIAIIDIDAKTAASAGTPCPRSAPIRGRSMVRARSGPAKSCAFGSGARDRCAGTTRTWTRWNTAAAPAVVLVRSEAES